MPEFVRDEEKWNKAKEIVQKEYGKTEADGDEFYALVMGVYKQARGTIHKEGKGTYYHHRHNGSDVKRTLPEGRDTAPVTRKSLTILDMRKLDVIDLEKAWQEDLHPRDNAGKFTNKGGEGNGGSQQTATAGQAAPAAGTQDGGRTNGTSDTGRDSGGNGRNGSPEASGSTPVDTAAAQVTGQPSRPAQDLPQANIQECKDSNAFYNFISAAKTGNPYGNYVDVHDADDYANDKLFTIGDGAAGCAVTPEGDIVSVFKHPDKAKALGLKHVSTDLLTTALQNGGKKLDCYDGTLLPNLYSSFGFIPVARVPFNRDYAGDDWNYDRDGEPDVIVFAHNGKSLADVNADRQNHTYKPYNAENVPIIDDYGKALEMRDHVLDHTYGAAASVAASAEPDIQKGAKTDIQKGIGADMVSKYPGGHWVTMRGTHVYITKGGEISSETALPKTQEVPHAAHTIQKGSQYNLKGKTVTIHAVNSKYIEHKDEKGKLRATPLKTFLDKAEGLGGNGNANSPDTTEVQGEQAQTSGTTAQAQGKGVPQTPKREAVINPRVAGDQPLRATAEQQHTATNADNVPTPAPLTAIGGKVVPGIPKYKDMQSLYDDWENQADAIAAKDKEGNRPNVYFRQQFAGLFAADKTEIANNQNQMYRRIELGGKTAALIMMQDSPRFKAVQLGYLEVAPSMRRGKGLGTSALLHTIEESYNRGYNGSIFLQAHTDAIPFYTKLGMRRMDTDGKTYFDFVGKTAQDFYKKATGHALDELNKALDAEPSTTEGTDFFKQLVAHEDSLWPDGLLIADLSTKVKTRAQGKYSSQPPEDKPLFNAANDEDTGGDDDNE
jgi:predicted GNAT family N-acyltransferase